MAHSRFVYNLYGKFTFVRTILFSFFSVSLGLMLGRASGFIREIYIANSLGASIDSDFVILLLTTPDFLVNLLVGGALSMALIPEFRSLNKLQARKLYNQVLLLAFIIFFTISSLLSFIPDFLIRLLAPGVYEKLSDDSIRWFSLSLFSIPFTVMAGASTAYLHYKQKFFVASLGTLLFNIIIIVSMQVCLLVGGLDIIPFVSVAILLAAIVRMLVFVISAEPLRKHKVYFTFDLITKDLLVRYIQCIFSGGFLFLIPILLRSISSTLGDNEISLVNYSTKLVEFPLGVLITVFSVVFFPKISQFFSEGKTRQFQILSTNLLLIVISVSVAAAIPLYLNSFYYIDLIFGNGKFTDYELITIANYLKLYVLTIPLQGINSLLISILSAQKNTDKPLYSSFSSVCVLFVLSSFYANSVEHLILYVAFSYLTSTLILAYFAFESESFRLDSSVLKLIPIQLFVLMAMTLIVEKYSGGTFTIIFDVISFAVYGLISFSSIRYLYLKAK